MATHNETPTKTREEEAAQAAVGPGSKHPWSWKDAALFWRI